MQDLIYCVDMGAGKHSCNYAEDVCPTLTRTNYGEPVVVYGIDMYNQQVTGDTAMSITGAATDSHHIPCVLIGKENNDYIPEQTES